MEASKNFAQCGIRILKDGWFWGSFCDIAGYIDEKSNLENRGLQTTSAKKMNCETEIPEKGKKMRYRRRGELQ